MHNLKLATLVSVVLAATPASALAANAYDATYGGQATKSDQVAPAQTRVAGDTANTSADAGTPAAGSPAAAGASAPTAAASTKAVSGDSLPFTGTDAGLVALAGLLVLALGLGVRRLSRTHPLA